MENLDSFIYFPPADIAMIVDSGIFVLIFFIAIKYLKNEIKN